MKRLRRRTKVKDDKVIVTTTCGKEFGTASSKAWNFTSPGSMQTLRLHLQRSAESRSLIELDPAM